MSRPAGRTLPGAEGTLFGGYGPFVALVALILAMALLAPTVAPERVVTTRPHPAVHDRRSSLTGGVREERRTPGGTADSPEDRRSSAAGAVAQERRSTATGDDGAAGGVRP
jgi:hypothetical protein